MFGLGMGELLVIGGVVVLLFGANKLPQLGGAVGESIRNFKRSVRDEDTKAIAEEKSKKKDQSEDE